MDFDFTILEEQLIRSSLTTKTDQEIAELIGHEVEKIAVFIDRICEGGAAARNERIESERVVKTQERKPFKNPKRKKDTSFDDENLTRVRAKRNKEIRDYETAQLEKRKRVETRTYKTRQIDFSKMKSIRIDAKTMIVVPIETPKKEAIALYEANRIIYERRRSQIEALK